MQGCSPKKIQRGSFLRNLTFVEVKHRRWFGHMKRGARWISFCLVCSHQQMRTQPEPFTSVFSPQRGTCTSSSTGYEVLGFYFLVGELFKDGTKYFATNVCIWMNEWVKEWVNRFCKTLESRCKGWHLNGDCVMCHFPREQVFSRALCFQSPGIHDLLGIDPHNKLVK